MLQGLPHAASDEEAVLNWRTESALAESTAMNIEANRTFFINWHSPF
jgi:hypothetical protein